MVTGETKRVSGLVQMATVVGTQTGAYDHVGVTQDSAGLVSRLFLCFLGVHSCWEKGHMFSRAFLGVKVLLGILAVSLADGETRARFGAWRPELVLTFPLGGCMTGNCRPHPSPWGIRLELQDRRTGLGPSRS